MREVIDLGPSPCEEKCAQVGEDNYYEMARKECKVYSKQLERVYRAEFGKECPVIIRTKSYPHDFGSYHEVVVSYDDNDAEEVEAAFWLEANCPQRWDDESRLELGLLEETG